MLERSSWEVAAEVLVSGVPMVEPVGVFVPVPVDEPLAFAACFAAFSARRFCLDAEGAMMGGGEREGQLIDARGDVEKKNFGLGEMTSGPSFKLRCPLIGYGPWQKPYFHAEMAEWSKALDLSNVQSASQWR
jgi:hypothetical protein